MTRGAAAGRDVRVSDADVYKQGTLAARLQRRPGEVVFSYDPEYLTAGLPAVATSLPLTPEPVVVRAGGVPPYFAGLLPEGRRLSGLRRAVKTSADDELGLLLAVGRDPVGDVQVVPSGERPEVGEPLITVERDFSEVSFGDILTESGVVDPTALAGVQDKASARMISVPVGMGSGRFVLKVDPPEYPHVVANEAYFIGVASRGGIPTVRARTVRDRTGRPGLLVDRVAGPDGGVDSLAVEDGTQVLGLYPADKYRVTTEELLDGLAHRCAARPIALRDLFRQVVYAWVTGNGDVHAKNVSILSSPTGEWRIAPAYDLPSTLPYRDHTMALSVGGRREGLSRRSLLAFAESIGLTQRAARRTLDDVLLATEGVVGDIEDGVVPFPGPVLRTWARALRNRRKSIMA
ncbi:MAG: type II toxin-antitoxin system HipA family toxin [Dermatophilaceae bacterium]